VPGELLDIGTGRLRTSSKDKRLSDQLRCFSRFDLGEDEEWGADLLRVISGSGLEEPADTSPPVPNTTREVPIKKSPISSEPGLPKDLPPKVPEKKPCEPIAKQSEQGKNIKRIPIPPLLPPTTLEVPLEIPDLGESPPDRLAPNSPAFDPALRRASSHHTPASVASTLAPASDYAISPDRRSPDSFGVYLSQSKSSLNLITPSSSGLHDQHSPPSSDDGADDAGSECSYLDFGTALREGGELTPQSSFSEKMRAYLPTPDKSALFDEGEERLPRHRITTLGQSHPDPTFSVPASIHSSLPSRASSPDTGLLVPPNTAAVFDTATPTTAVSPKGSDKPAPRDERTSIALSTLSSDSSQVHEATVQTAYATMLREEWAKTDGQKRDRNVGAIVEESEAGDNESEAGRSGSEGGFSAMEALDDAARRIAGAKRSTRPARFVE
jgi:hypothetical protein